MLLQSLFREHIHDRQIKGDGAELPRLPSDLTPLEANLVGPIYKIEVVDICQCTSILAPLAAFYRDQSIIITFPLFDNGMRATEETPEGRFRGCAVGEVFHTRCVRDDFVEVGHGICRELLKGLCVEAYAMQESIQSRQPRGANFVNTVIRKRGASVW